MEGGILPWILQQFAITYQSSIAGIVTHHGIRNNCELGEESRRQVERRYDIYNTENMATSSMTVKCP